MKNKIILPALLIIILTASAQAATLVINSVGDGTDANLADNICQTATAGATLFERDLLVYGAAQWL